MKKGKTKTSQKIRYEVDDFNRLIISKPYASDSPLRKKTIVEGYFKVDKNRLSYYISSKDKRLDDGIPHHKINFKGKWVLTKDYNLNLTLDESRTQIFGDSLVLKGEILKVDGYGLTFRLRKRTTPTKRQLSDIRLGGVWQADKNNRLVLKLRRQKEKDTPFGKLIFEGAWQLNKRNELIYCYKRDTLKTKSKISKNLIFKGYWQMNKNRLVYQLNRSKKSFFSFRISLRTPSLRADENKLRYQVGIEYETKRNRKRKVVKEINIFGRWKIKKDLMLAFEITPSNGKCQTLIFESIYYFKGSNEITFRIKNRYGVFRGLEVCFTKRFLKDKELFLRLKKEKEERRIEAAIKIPF